MPRYEVWDDGSSLTVLRTEDVLRHQQHGLLGTHAVRVAVIDASDWEACMHEHHQRQGLEPYVPWEDDAG